ncbi:MAG: ABC transporter permease subunit [Candidatus Nanopelagicales bacterium]|jgi:ABC-2 type transport system permease protein
MSTSYQSTYRVYTQTLSVRWRSVAIAVISLAVLLFFGIAVYRGIDPNIYSGLPESLRSLVGLPVGADVATLAYSAIYATYGGLTMAAMAIAAGVSSLAGDERRGLLSVLLAQPSSRSAVLWAKAAALATVFVAGVVLLLGAAYLAPVVLSIEIGALSIAGFTLHLLAMILFFLALAFALGAWTGQPTLAAGLTSGVLVVSFFAVGLLPLVSSVSWLARAFPWYYYTSSDPLNNGADPWHLLVLGGATLVLALLAWWGFSRRDLGNTAVGLGVVDRVRQMLANNPLPTRFPGTPRVSSIWLKTLGERQGLLLLVSVLMFGLMGVLMGPIYASLDSLLTEVSQSFSPQLLAFFGGGDLSSPEGFFQVESLGLVAPIAILVVTIVIGANSVAGEESRRTAGILLANPLPRSSLLLQNAAAMVLGASIIGVFATLGIMIANAISRLGMSYVNIAATGLLLTLLGIFFGSFAVLLSGFTGSVRIAIVGSAGFALIGHVVQAMATIADASWGFVSPFAYYLGNDPLVNGITWWDPVVLTAGSVAFLAVAGLAYQRRDLRVGNAAAGL